MELIELPWSALIAMVLAVAGMMATVHAALLWVKRLPSRQTDTLEHGPADSEVLCPSCRQPMRRGVSHATKGIVWRSHDDPPLRHSTTVLRALPNTRAMLQPGVRGNRSWRCGGCRLVLVDYGRLIEKGVRA